jgi:hypothetical protein
LKIQAAEFLVVQTLELFFSHVDVFIYRSKQQTRPFCLHFFFSFSGLSGGMKGFQFLPKIRGNDPVFNFGQPGDPF